MRVLAQRELGAPSGWPEGTEGAPPRGLQQAERPCGSEGHGHHPPLDLGFRDAGLFALQTEAVEADTQHRTGKMKSFNTCQ